MKTRYILIEFFVGLEFNPPIRPGSFLYVEEHPRCTIPLPWIPVSSTRMTGKKGAGE